MVDLVGQHAKIQTELDEAIGRVMATGAFVKGPEVAAFAQELAEFTGSKHVIPCGNGTDALQIALMALGIGPGDEKQGIAEVGWRLPCACTVLGGIHSTPPFARV